MKKADTPLFEKLSSINFNDKTEKKQKLTYLSWAWAWSEFKKLCPDARYEIVKDPETAKPYIVDELGILVQTRVTVGDETHEMWLPVMDGANKAMKIDAYTYKVKEYKNGSWSGKFVDKAVEPATMFDVNKTLMRCLVKNLAMFGLAIYIYAGEDLPDAPNDEPTPKPEPKKEPIKKEMKPTPKPTPKPTIENARLKLALKSISDGTYTENQLREKFALTPDQLTMLDDHMTEIEKAIEEMKTSIEEPKPAPAKKKATPKKKTTTPKK